jgi:glycosyltransferase involved in cell wall biosynthesis
MREAKALIFPGEEDFGITPVEMLASGRPVIAYGRGGILDTVTHGETGWLFEEQTVDALVDAILAADKISWDGLRLRSRAEEFRPEVFRERFSSTVLAAWNNLR